MAFSSSQGMHTTHFATSYAVFEIFFPPLASCRCTPTTCEIGSRGRTRTSCPTTAYVNFNVGQSDLKIIPLQASCGTVFRFQIAAPLSSHWPSHSRNLLAMVIGLAPSLRRRGAQSSNSDPRRVAHSVQDSQRWQIALPRRSGTSVKSHHQCQAPHSVA